MRCLVFLTGQCINAIVFNLTLCSLGIKLTHGAFRGEASSTHESSPGRASWRPRRAVPRGEARCSGGAALCRFPRVVISVFPPLQVFPLGSVPKCSPHTGFPSATPPLAPRRPFVEGRRRAAGKVPVTWRHRGDISRQGRAATHPRGRTMGGGGETTGPAGQW